MSFFTLLVTYGFAALGFFLLTDGIAYFVANTGDRGAARLRRRLEAENEEPITEDAPSIALAESTKSLTEMGSYLGRLAQRAHIDIPVYRIYFVVIALALALFLLMSLFMPFVPKIVLGFAAAVTAFVFPIVYLQGKVRQRLSRFHEQFPDALELIVRSLRIGHPVSAALTNIGEEIPDPLGGEFRIAAQQVVYGKSAQEAIRELANRVDLPDVHFFAVAVQIHHESGGNLAEILAGLSDVIRGRFHLFRKVKALTVEGRFSAWFLSLFPIVMIFAMSGLEPGYYEKVSDLAYFPYIVAFTFILLVLNVIVMRTITKLEV